MDSLSYDQKLKRLVEKSISIKAIGLTLAMVISISVSSVVYVKIAIKRQELRNNHELKFVNLLRSQAKDLRMVSETVKLRYKIENLTVGLMERQALTKSLIAKQTARLENLSQKLVKVEQENKNLTENYDAIFQNASSTYDKQKQALDEQKEKIKNIKEKYKEIQKSISDQRSDYLSLDKKYKEKVQNATNNLTKEISDHGLLIEEKLDKQKTNFTEIDQQFEDSLSWHQEVQNSVQNQSENLVSISASLEVVEEDLSGCAAYPCVNEGTCTSFNKSYSCTCKIGYNGTNCEENIDECSSSPCANGGNCNDQVNGYSCTCASGYSGTNCEGDIDECSSSPCQGNGECADAVNSYACTCFMGSTGTNCENEESGTSRPGNGYVYKRTETTASGNNIQEVCQSYGGDLSYHGHWDLTIRQQIFDDLGGSHNYYYGLNKVNDVWQYLNGTAAIHDVINWANAEPPYTCSGTTSSQMITYSFTCNGEFSGLCEREL